MRTIVGLVFALGCVVQAQAAIDIHENDEDGWLAAVSSTVHTINWDDISPPLAEGASVIISGDRYTSTGATPMYGNPTLAVDGASDLHVGNPDNPNAPFFGMDFYPVSEPNCFSPDPMPISPQGILTVTFDKPMMAIGAWFLDVEDDYTATGFRFAASGPLDAAFSASQGDDSWSFLGIISDTPFTSIEIHLSSAPNGNGVGLDDVEYAACTGCYDPVWVDDDAAPAWYDCDHVATVQEGVDRVCVGGTVNVAAGAYPEQVYIGKSLDLVGAGVGATILNAVPVDGRAPYSITQWTGSARTIDACIGVKDAGTVNISGFTVDGLDLGPNNFHGIHYFNTSGAVTDCRIEDITDSAHPGNSRIVSLVATHGVGETLTIDFSNNVIPNMQKGGIVIMGPGASFTVNGNDIADVPSDTIAGNCIQLSYGATGSTLNNTVQGAVYSGSDWASTGILLFESGDIDMVGDEVFNCENGVNFSDWGWVHLHATPVNLTFTDLNLHGNAWTLGAQLSRDDSDLNMTVTDCDMVDSSGDGIDVFGTGPDPWGGAYYTGWDNGDLNVSVSGCKISGNTLDGVWTADYSGNANAIHSFDIYNTSFAGNSGSAINNMFPAYTVNASGCWWGDAGGPIQGTPLSRGERQVAPPAQPFGEDPPGGGGAGVMTESNLNGTPSGETIFGSVDYTPWMANDGNYTNPGFDGDFSVLWVDDDSPQTGATCRIQEGIDMVTASTVNVAAGTYDGPLNIEGFAGLTVIGVDASTVTFAPTGTLDWGFYGGARQTAIRVVNSTEVVLQNMTMDFASSTGNNHAGILYWDSTGAITDNILKNVGLPDASGGYYELTAYLRAPSYTDGNRAAITVSGNEFIDTGRLGVVTHQYVDVTITGNTFHKEIDDFGYAMELGSESIATVSGNTIYGYDTPAASDDSNSAGIYVENSFTYATSGVTKTVSISGNEVYDCQWALYMGNEFDGYAGDVDIVADISGNTFHDNVDGAIVVTDEDQSAGSSVTATFQGNTVADNGGYGYFIYTQGDGDITATITDEMITGHEIGVYLYDDAPGASSSTYDIDVTQSTICENTTFGMQNDCAGVTIMAEDNWWGDVVGPYDDDSDGSETTEVDNGTCTGDPAVEKNEDGSTDNVGDTSGMVVDYCPWLTHSPFCGDGEVDTCEECDDGNADNTDDCLDTCAAASCGDGFLWDGVEECDDGNTDPDDGCSATCTIETGACCVGTTCTIETMADCAAAGGSYFGADSACDDNDTDGDGLRDECDQCPYDPNKIVPGICGCGVDDHADSDSDGVPDCIDCAPGVDDDVFCPGCQYPECGTAIPTVSQWGLVILALLLLVVGKVYFGQGRRVAS